MVSRKHSVSKSEYLKLGLPDAVLRAGEREARKYGFDPEDGFQEAYLAWIDACEKCDDEDSRIRFACVTIRYELRNKLLGHRSDVDAIAAASIRPDAGFDGGDEAESGWEYLESDSIESDSDPLSILIAAEEINARIKREEELEKMSHYTRLGKIVDMREMNYTFAEIGKELGISPQRVHLLLHNAALRNENQASFAF